MSLNPGGMNSFNWNYSNQQKDGFSLELYGTIVSLQEVQAREYNPNSNQPGRPAFWPDGNPKMNIRVGFATPDGTLKSLVFQKAGKKQVAGEKPSVHMQLFNLTSGNMMDLIGKTVHMWTWPANPNTGQAWGQGNPRLFGVEEVEGGVTYQLSGSLPEEFKVPELYANDAVSGGQPVQPVAMAPQQIQQPQVPPMQGNFYAAPTAQPMQQPMMQPVMQQPMQQPMQQQPMPQPMMQQQPQPTMQAMPPQQAMPVGMDPAIAAAMQSVGATNVQQVQDPYAVYDDDIPFA